MATDRTNATATRQDESATEASPARLRATVAGEAWMYGYSTYTKSGAVVINSNSMRYRESWHVGHREHTFEFGPKGDRLIVGWEVISNWNDGTNGGWWKSVDQILLKDYLAVHVKSLYDRGCDWSLIVYYVDAKDYQFES